MNLTLSDIQSDITHSVRIALKEDIGNGDLSAQLIPKQKTATATIITREPCVLCGQAWLEETFKQHARTLLTGERTALNFLQLLSATATKAKQYAQALQGSPLKILDTRKTLPGLRTAQKYAVTIGGCHNHRIGLYDAFLIKENHIAACGGIPQAIKAARDINPNVTVEVETENLNELQTAIDAGADIAMLDNFSEEALKQALALDRKSTLFEVSGNLDIQQLKVLSQLAIDYCSFGSLTKHIHAVDLSMRIQS